MSKKSDIREAYLSQRHKRIGSTDVGAILGLSQYANAYDVWLAKTGKLKQKDDLKDNQAATAGIAFEDGVLDWAEELLGDMKRKVIVIPDTLPVPIGTELDAVLTKTGEPINAKTAGLIGPLQKDKWGDEGTEEVPELYYIQAQIEMLLTEKEIQHIPAFLGGRGFVYYKIARAQDVIDAIMERMIKFWDVNVMQDIPPDDIIPHLDVVKWRKRVPNKIVAVERSIIEVYKDLSQAEKDVKKLKEAAQGELIAAMGDAEATEFIEDVGQVTFFEASTTRVDAPKLKKFHADVCAECSKTSTGRKMVVRKKALTKMITGE